ncbi:MAG: DUF4838 domain-containing protein [Gemmatimonadetes bacterium]|nr:DUF4838 domain-containing protein [Gemmatimonadota bacterium]
MRVIGPEEIRDVQIVIAAAATDVEGRAADELQNYMRLITGVEFPIVADSAPRRDREILLGRNRRLDELGIVVDWQALAEDGFTIRTEGERIAIFGGSHMGTLYGVYGFLEDFLDCRFYTPEVRVIPRRERGLQLPANIDTTQVPVVKFRELYYTIARDPEYSAWHKLDHHDTDWGMWVHTFHPLLAPDDYFEEHPEYFSLVKGKRIPNGQLCLTDEGVFRILVGNLRKRIVGNPQAQYWSVSQNDTFGYCECDRCAAVNQREGTPMGSILEFVNRVAAEFPDKTISTLAYQYSRPAPAHLKPADNVNIVLCTIELNRSRPIATDAGAASFRKDMEDWARITDNILIWDYVIQFSNLVSPFPNLRVLQPNLRYFVDNHAVAIFQQGNREVGGEFSELRAYVIAKLLWNPDADAEALVDDFISGYYGEAAAFIRQYVDLMHDTLTASGKGLSIFGNPHAPTDGYLSPDMMAEYNRVFDGAEAAVGKDQPEVLQRVRIARLPLNYAMLEQAKSRVAGAGGMFRKDSGGGWEVRPEIRRRLELFTELCNLRGVSRVTEWHTTPDEYRERFLKLLERTPLDHLASGRPVDFRTPYSPKYPAAGDQTLTDGLRGPLDHSFNWLGFEGSDMEVVVNLREPRTISRVSADFLQTIGSWIFLPERVVFEVSTDGEHYQPLAEVGRQAEEREGGTFAETFAADFAPLEARYVSVRGVSRKTCPDWHIGAGGPSWIFTDEIVVQ